MLKLKEVQIQISIGCRSWWKWIEIAVYNIDEGTERIFSEIKISSTGLWLKSKHSISSKYSGFIQHNQQQVRMIILLLKW